MQNNYKISPESGSLQQKTLTEGEIMVFIFSWWIKQLYITIFLAIISFFICLFIPNLTVFSVLYIFLSVIEIGVLNATNNYLKKMKNIRDFLKKQKENEKEEFPMGPIIPKKNLIKGVFKYNISCKTGCPFSFHSQLYVKESLEILDSYH